jgi:hypothetical protein
MPMKKPKKIRKPLLAPVQFRGTLRHGTDIVPISFRASIGPDGALRPVFRPVRLSKKALFIKERWSDGDRAGQFIVEARAKSGHRLTSEHLELDSTGTKGSARGSFITLGGDFADATITWPLTEPAKQPVLSFLIKGALGYDLLKADTSLGELAFRANHTVSNYNEITGQMMLRGPATGDIEVWRQAGLAMMRRLLKLLSFAGNHFLRAPVEEFIAGDQDRLDIRSQFGGTRPFLPPIHFLDQEPFFLHAVQVADKKPDLVATLESAIEWHAMAADYNEMRLFAKTTALECLMWAVLPHMQGKSFAARLDALVREWKVPMRDLTTQTRADLIKARNHIVHRGDYYASRAPGQPELWNHILVAHEIVTRAILKALEFKGRYECCLGGLHTREFPSCKRPA